MVGVTSAEVARWHWSFSVGLSGLQPAPHRVTIRTVRKVAVAIPTLAAMGAITWALWPATSWPASFCKPVVRVVGGDVNAIAAVVHAQSMSSNVNAPVTSAERSLVALVTRDISLANAHAPTAQLRHELTVYGGRLEKARTTDEVISAIGHFDEEAATQLSSCGVTPIATRRSQALP